MLRTSQLSTSLRGRGPPPPGVGSWRPLQAAGPRRREAETQEAPQRAQRPHSRLAGTLGAQLR